MPRSVKSTSVGPNSDLGSRRGRYRGKSHGDGRGGRHGGTGAANKHRPPFPSSVVYGRTKLGQLLYDLAFTDMPDRYLAQKHGKPVAKIREWRTSREIKGLRQKNKLKNGPETRR